MLCSLGPTADSIRTAADSPHIREIYPQREIRNPCKTPRYSRWINPHYRSHLKSVSPQISCDIGKSAKISVFYVTACLHDFIEKLIMNYQSVHTSPTLKKWQVSIISLFLKSCEIAKSRCKHLQFSWFWYFLRYLQFPTNYRNNIGRVWLQILTLNQQYSLCSMREVWWCQVEASNSCQYLKHRQLGNPVNVNNEHLNLYSQTNIKWTFTLNTHKCL